MSKFYTFQNYSRNMYKTFFKKAIIHIDIKMLDVLII